ncbi:MAG: TOMM precursor leader peptide-binding protein, partial [Dehalococcoidia bacterium]
MTITRPSFKNFYHVEPLAGVGLFLLTEVGFTMLSGPLYSQLGPLVNGQHTAEEIVDLLDGQVSATEVYYGLGQLEQRGLVVEAEVEIAPAVAAYWQMLDLDAARATQRLAQSSVSITALDEHAVPALSAALQSLGIPVVDRGGFQVVLTDDYLQPTLASINQEKLATGEPWMLVKPVGTIVWLGPIFRPGQNACWECLAQRLRMNRMTESFLLEKKGISDPFKTSLAVLPTTLDLAANLAAIQVGKWLADDRGRRTEDNVLTFNTLTLANERHTLVRRPQCPVCGNPEQYSKPIQVQLQSRLKRFTADGGHRIMPPEQTVNRFEHHVSPITGAIKSLQRSDTGENPVMHAYLAGHNFAQNYSDMASLRRTLRMMAGGKGATDIQAKASAIGEAIERYSGVYRGDEPRIKASYRSLAEKAIHPRDLLLISDEQYQTRKLMHGEGSLYQYVPPPYEDATEIDWTPVWSLSQNRFKYVPTSHAYYNYAPVAGIRGDQVFCLADSNGTAAGNT